VPTKMENTNKTLGFSEELSHNQSF
jgi:hypothetical protein